MPNEKNPISEGFEKINKEMADETNNVDLTGVKFENKSVVYDGKPQTIVATDLPEGVTATYKGGDQTKVGVHTVTATLVGEFDNLPTDLTAELTITEKPAPSVTGVKFESKSFVYDGKPHKIEATGVPAGVVTKYTSNERTEVGSQKATLTLSFDGGAGSKVIDTKEANLTITKPDADLSGVKFENKSVVYDGKSHTIVATNLPEGVTATYTGGDKTEVGVHTVTATLNGEFENLPTDLTAELTITEKPAPSVTGVKFEDKSAVYDGKLHKIEATNVPAGVVTKYTNNERTEVGSQKATLTLSFDGGAGSKVIDTKEATLTITEKPANNANLSDVVFEDKTVTEDGEPHSLELTGNPTGTTVAYEGNGKSEPGEHTVTATISGEFDNLPKTYEAKLIITKKDEPEVPGDGSLTEQQKEEIKTIMKAEDCFDYLRVGEIITECGSVNEDKFFEFMKAYVAEEALWNANHYRLVEIYNETKPEEPTEEPTPEPEV